MQRKKELDAFALGVTPSIHNFANGISKGFERDTLLPKLCNGWTVSSSIQSILEISLGDCF